MSQTWLFRNTASKRGRSIVITPNNSAFKAISTGRILLDKEHPNAAGQNMGQETTLLCLHGSGRVKVGDETFTLSRFDGVYVSRGTAFEVETDEFVDIVEASAPTNNVWPTKYVNFEQEVKNNEGLTLHVGAEPYLFFDMPKPGFGTQFIYSDLENPEFVQPVYEDDAVTIVEGYHPNVAAPGYPVNFCWVLCSLEDDTWRTLANVNVQKGFETMPTGLR